MDETLRLNDGTLLNGHALLTGNDLLLYISGMTLAEAYPLLSDEGKVNHITEDRYGEKTTYDGYRHLFFIREELSGMLTAGLRKVDENG